MVKRSSALQGKESLLTHWQQHKKCMSRKKEKRKVQEKEKKDQMERHIQRRWMYKEKGENKEE